METEEVQTVETETPVVESEPQEVESVSEVEMPEAATSEQPTEEASPKSRSQERIHQLTKEKEEARQEAEYWKNLNKQPEALPIEESDEGFTLDQIASSVINKQREIEAEKLREDAKQRLQADVAETAALYPELDADEDLAAIVISTAQTRGISIKAAAEKVMGLVSEKKQEAEKRTLAAQAQRAGVTSPQGAPVSNGSPAPVDVSSMTEEEKAANWNSIVAAYNN